MPADDAVPLSAAVIEKLEQASVGSRELDAEIAAAIGDMNDPTFCVDHYLVPPTYEVDPGRYGGPYVGARVTVKGHSRIVCSREPRPYTTSLDAALTLVPKGVWWSLFQFAGTVGSGGDAYMAEVVLGGYKADAHLGLKVWGNSLAPAVALCIAALRARAAIRGLDHRGGKP